MISKHRCSLNSNKIDMVIENDGVLIQMDFQAYLITLKCVG